jgi:putative spermidine/putrescine transport system ATP-binding protein
MNQAVSTVSGAGIILKNVTKKYGTETAVDNVNFDIRPGEFFSMLGPSGSGKTTTLMMIAGFTGIDSGTIDVDNKDVSLLPPQKRGFGMVFQNYAIFPHLTVYENVAFPLRARRLAEEKIKERVTWALNLAQLGSFANRYSRQLSGGQQQRVAIARAIVFEPSVVLMDEPLGALDKNLRYNMQVEIKEIQRRLGMTVVYVTHDQEEAMNMSDRIAIMNHGHVEHVGPPSEVYDSPSNAFVARFLGEANLIEGLIDGSDGDVATLKIGGLALRAKLRSSVDPGRRAALFVRPERLHIGGQTGPGANQVLGRVSRVSFLGNIVRYRIDIAPTASVMVDAQNTGRPPAIVGSQVPLIWSVEDSLLLVD